MNPEHVAVVKQGKQAIDAWRKEHREVREYFIPDFSNWKDHDAFEAAFSRLLKDLRASAE